MSLTRADESRRIQSRLPDRSSRFFIYGPQFEYIAGPGRVITGIVRDAETRQPVAGVIVASEAFDGVRTADGGNLSATTDAGGRYRLDQLSRNRRITVTATRPNSDYVPTDIGVGRPGTIEPIHKEMALSRGVCGRPRLQYQDGSTRGGHTVLYAVPVEQICTEEWHSGNMQFLDYMPAGDSDAEGRFRIPILPGRGVIALHAFGNYVPAFGASKSQELSNQQTESRHSTL